MRVRGRDSTSSGLRALEGLLTAFGRRGTCQGTLPGDVDALEGKEGFEQEEKEDDS